MKIIKQYIFANKIKIPSMKRPLDNPGLTKYLPSFSREWKNIIYSYNKNIVRNIPMNYSTINKLIKNYFNLYFKNTYFIKAKLKLFLWRRRGLLNKIYVSDADIKYTNNKAIITLFTISTKKNELIKKYLKINKKIRKNFVRHFIKIYKELPWQLNYLINKKNNLSSGNLFVNKKYLFVKEVLKKENFIQYKLQYLRTFTRLNYFYIKKIWMSIKIKYLIRKIGKLYWRERIDSGEKSFIQYNSNKYTDLYNSNTTKFLLRKILTGKTNKLKSTRQYLLLLRRYQLLYALNEYKFNKSKYLPILSNYLNKITGKKIEYNIVNLKSIINSPDLFTHYMALNAQKSKQNIGITSLSNITNKPFIYKEQNTLLSKTPLDIFEKKDSLIQKFKNPKIISNFSEICSETYKQTINSSTSLQIKTKEKMTKKNLDNLLIHAYSSNENIYYTIYNNIKYKNISGIKLEIKGRLTKRYKAERAKHYTDFKGGLKNKDSSYRKQSTLLFRGNTNINSSYYLQKAKRRVGSFAIKGWISGK